MSRCFPFPPPGYEKKPRSDHEDLLLKEKQKETKHRKEKKDKDKREGKERKDREKDKDRSKDKHREKKHKKAKHRDKDKKKRKDRDNDKKRVSNDRKGEHTGGHNEGKLGEESCEAEYFKDPKFMELGKGTRDESGTRDQMAEKITGKVQRTFECIRSSSQKGRTPGDKMAQNITIPEQRRMDMVSPMEDRGTENAPLQNSMSEEQRKVNGMGRPMVKDENKKIGGKEKAKEQEVDYGKGEIPKDRVQEKMHKGKNKDGNKEKEKEKEKIREKGEHKHKVQDKLRDIEKKEQLDTLNVTSFAPKDEPKIACADGSLKRKEINGFLHENEMRCNKLSRPSSSSSSQLPLENGKLDQSNIHGPCASHSGGTANVVKVERISHRESKSNGVSNVRLPAVLHPPENCESLKKSPHPDEKYLSQILQVPKMDDWPQFDDQDWLLSRDNVRQKPDTNLQADESLRVWASALRIESADVLALPYVIPY